MQGFISAVLLSGTKVQPAVKGAEKAENNSAKERITQIAHSYNQPCSHGQENRSNLFRGTRRGSKAYQTERPGHRNAGAHVSVDHHNYHTPPPEAGRALLQSFWYIGSGTYKTRLKSNQLSKHCPHRAKKIRWCNDARHIRIKNPFKNISKHVKSSFDLLTRILPSRPDRLIRIWKTMF